jgi:predicted transposase YbfD/YdcC
MDRIFVKDRLALMLDHFAAVGDPREGCKVKYPLGEVLFLATCATIAGCDDCDEIADWGVEHQSFLKGYAEYFFGTPKEDWLRVVLNRIDPALFEACFMAWALSLRADAVDLIALDGKSLRRSSEADGDLKPIHLVSAWASTQRLVLAQEAVDAKDNECAAMLAILERLPIKGALVTIDAIATNPAVAGTILGKGGDYLLALKRNQPTLHGEVAAYFDDPAATGLATVTALDKDHGRIETRTTTVSHDVGWLSGDRRHPGEHRFVGLKCLVRAVAQIERMTLRAGSFGQHRGLSAQAAQSNLLAR